MQNPKCSTEPAREAEIPRLITQLQLILQGGTDCLDQLKRRLSFVSDLSERPQTGECSKEPPLQTELGNALNDAIKRAINNNSIVSDIS